MLGATPTFHRHRSPLCIMVHNAGLWSTVQVRGLVNRKIAKVPEALIIFQIAYPNKSKITQNFKIPQN